MTYKLKENEFDKSIDWVDRLSEDDYVIIDNFIDDKLFEKLRDFFLTKLEEEDFKAAGIGPLTNHQIVPSIRKDFIYWINKDEDESIEKALELFDDVTQALRRYCFLSISDSEFHLAHYPSGAYYHKHVDQFKNRGNRLISLILYLNKDWKKGDGGELRIFKEDGFELIEPIGKRLVMFKSDLVPHEVLKTNVSRYSLTGWLLNKPKGVGYLLG